jgi:ribonuclease BN (tRNA processing enzyme)
MRVKILGCSGGVGGRSLHTTCLQLDDDILIDAGSGSAELSLDALAKIDHVFITHSHLDHVAHLPFILDSVGDRRKIPLTMYATKETQDIIRAHIFNWLIWPDFSQIPSVENPYLQFQTIKIGESIRLGSNRLITAIPANHAVPAVGYQLDSGIASLVFTGDTTVCPELWETVNRIENLKTLIIESAFPDAERELAILSKHLCPSLLEQELKQLKRYPEIFITHAKPGQLRNIGNSIAKFAGPHLPKMLRNNQIFEF